MRPPGARWRQRAAGAGRRTIAGGCCSIALLLATASAHAARTDWREMTVGHFHLYSTLSDSGTRNVARYLQAFEQTVGRLLEVEDPLPDLPTNIFILSDADFQKYVADYRGLAGLFLGTEFANYIVIDGAQEFESTKATVFHEYTHFVQNNTSSVQYPPWYSEGYAELFSAFRIKGDSVIVGEAPHNLSMSIDKADWLPVERVLAVKQTDPEYRAERLMPQFYGESWALVHYLLFDDSTLHAPTFRYLRNVDLGFPEKDAFASAFPFDKAGLDAAVRKLLQKQIIRIKKLTFEQPPAIEQAPITRVPAAEADMQIARLALVMGRPKEVVEPLASAALAESPSDVRARALAAHVAADFDSSVDLAPLYTALGSGADLTDARIDVAAAQLDKSLSEASAAKVVSLLNATVHGERPPLEAVMLWARAAAASRVKAELIVAALELGQPRAPHNTDLLTMLAAEYALNGQRAKARACYNRLILIARSQEQRAWAVRMADSEGLQDETPVSRH